MVSCRDLTEEVTRYLEGEMSWWELASTRWHLFLCEACRTYMEQMRLTRATLHARGDDPNSQDVARTVMEIYDRWLAEQREAGDGGRHASPDA